MDPLFDNVKHVFSVSEEHEAGVVYTSTVSIC